MEKIIAVETQLMQLIKENMKKQNKTKQNKKKNKKKQCQNKTFYSYITTITNKSS